MNVKFVLLGLVMLAGASYATTFYQSSISLSYNSITNTLTIVEVPTLSANVPSSGSVQIQFFTTTVSNVILSNSFNSSFFSGAATYTAPPNKKENQTFTCTNGAGPIVNTSFNTIVICPGAISNTVNVSSGIGNQTYVFSPLKNTTFKVNVGRAQSCTANAIITPQWATPVSWAVNSFPCNVNVTTKAMNSLLAVNFSITGNYPTVNINRALGLNTWFNFSRTPSYVVAMIGNTQVGNIPIPLTNISIQPVNANSIAKSPTLVEAVFNAEVGTGCAPGSNITVPNRQTGGIFSICTKINGSAVSIFDLGAETALKTGNLSQGLGQAWIASLLAERANSTQGYQQAAYWRNQTYKIINQSFAAQTALMGPPIPLPIYNSIRVQQGALTINGLIIALNTSQSQQGGQSAGWNGALFAVLVMFIFVMMMLAGRRIMKFVDRKKPNMGVQIRRKNEWYR